MEIDDTVNGHITIHGYIVEGGSCMYEYTLPGDETRHVADGLEFALVTASHPEVTVLYAVQPSRY